MLSHSNFNRRGRGKLKLTLQSANCQAACAQLLLEIVRHG
jgi:hypothetical protein